MTVWTGMENPSAALGEKSLFINDPTEDRVYEPLWLLKAPNVCVLHRLGPTPFPSIDFPDALEVAVHRVEAQPARRQSPTSTGSKFTVAAGGTFSGILQELLPFLLAKPELLV